MVAIDEMEMVSEEIDQIPVEAREVLHVLASGWGDVEDCQALEVVPLKGAMTNQVFQIKWKTTTTIVNGSEREEEEEATNSQSDRKALVRVYGEGVELLFDRDDEVRTFESLSRNGVGPKLLGRFPNGRIEEFIHSRTLSAQDLRDPEISAIIASKLREFHELDMPGPNKVLLWDRLRNWLKVAKRLCSSEEVKEFCLEMMEDEISSLENELSDEDQKIGFCHNDLQYGNIMMDDYNCEDYEYASFNPIAYDIANHFSEMAADYHTETPHILDYNKYPDLDERKTFVQIYLSSADEKPEHVEVDNLLENIEKYVLASHLTWGLWGLISDHVNDIDFDYLEYARQRFQQYWLRKSETLGCTPY